VRVPRIVRAVREGREFTKADALSMVPFVIGEWVRAVVRAPGSGRGQR